MATNTESGPVTLLSEERFLDSSTLEAHLTRRKVWEQQPDGTVSLGATASAAGVRFDLCAVEWFDLGATAHLIALAEAILRAGATLEVVPPLSHERANERRWLATKPDRVLVDGLRRRVQHRRRATRMWDVLGISNALREAAARLAAEDRLRILEDVDTTADTTTADKDARWAVPPRADDTFREPDSLAPAETEHRRRRDVGRMSRVRWLSFEDRDEVRDFAQQIAELLLDPLRANLHPVDARALTNAIFHELLENVTVHAESTRHAVVVAWIRPSSAQMPARAYLPHEQPYVDWVQTLRVPVLDLVIADSGSGASRSLRQHFPASARGDANIAALPPGDAQVLAWAWYRYSTRLTGTSRSGTRGLYRVDRVAGRHHGLATLRAGTQSVGWDHGGHDYDRLVASPTPLAPVPGTVVHLLLPTVPVQDAPVRVPDDGVPSTDDITVRWVHLGEAPSATLTERQSALLQARTAADQVGRPVCVVAQVDEAPEDADLRATVLALAHASHPAPLVVYGLSDNAVVLRAAVDSSRDEARDRALTDDSRGPTETDVGAPVLVMLPDGGAMWGGAPVAIARILDQLVTQPETVLGPEELAQRLPTTELLEEFYRLLRSAPALARKDPNGTVRPRLSVLGLVAKLREGLRHVTEREVAANGGRLVHTPTLQLTRAWLPTDTLWSPFEGELPALFALAGLARAHISEATLGDATLVVDSATQELSGARFQRYLRCRDMVRLPHYSEQALSPAVPLLKSGGDAVVYCHVISSGESVRRSLKQVLRDGGHPIAVLCIVDGRDESAPVIRVFDQDYPIHSLVRGVSLLADPAGHHAGRDSGREAAVRTFDANSITVSPLTGRVERGEHPERVEVRPRDGATDAGGVPTAALDGAGARAPGVPGAADGSGAEIVRHLIANEGLHFTHVARPNGRHFTVWVDTVELAALPIVRERIKYVIDTWLSEVPGTADGPSLAMWYPVTLGTDNPALRQLAVWLQDALGRRCRVVPVQRAAAYGRWVFPAAVDVGPSPSRVVILDTSAVEGTTVGSLVRLAAECGAGAILACLPLCQLAPEQRALLEGLTEIRVDALAATMPGQVELALDVPGARKRVPHTARVRVQFLSQLSSTAYPLEACPVCAQRRQIDALRPSDEGLDDIRTTIVEWLRPRDSRDVAKQPPASVIGGPISAAELDELLAWRVQLTEALTSTRARWDLLARVDALVPRDEEDSTVATAEVRRHALLHLLAVEGQWLRLPPLEFNALRTRLTRIAAQVVRDTTSGDEARLRALTVLRLANTHGFIRQLETLLAAVAGRPLLEEQVLFAVYTFVERPFHVAPRALDDLVEALQHLGDVGPQGLGLVSQAVARIITHLSGRAHARRLEARRHHLTRPMAADLLRRALVDVPQGVRTAFAEMHPVRSGNLDRLVVEHRNYQSSGTMSPPAERWLRDLGRHLETFRQWVHDHLVMYLQKLLPLLEDPDGGAPMRPQLRTLVSGRRAPDADPFFQAAAEIAAEQDIPIQRTWSTYGTNYEWWATLLGIDISAPAASPSPLIVWLDTIPAKLTEVVAHLREFLGDAERLCVVDPDDAAARIPGVFAPQRFANRVFEEFVWSLVDSVPNDGSTTEIGLAPGLEDGKHVRFRVTVATDAQEASGAGGGLHERRSEALVRLADRLDRVGARVEVERDHDPGDGPWSFVFSFDSAFDARVLEPRQSRRGGSALPSATATVGELADDWRL